MDIVSQLEGSPHFLGKIFLHLDVATVSETERRCPRRGSGDHQPGPMEVCLEDRCEEFVNVEGTFGRDGTYPASAVGVGWSKAMVPAAKKHVFTWKGTSCRFHIPWRFGNPDARWRQTAYTTRSTLMIDTFSLIWSAIVDSDLRWVHGSHKLILSRIFNRWTKQLVNEHNFHLGYVINMQLNCLAIPSNCILW